MKVFDIMSTSVDSVGPNTKVKDVCRIIFGRGINGVPVCKNKKIIGFITEKDILSKFFPSMQEYVEDPFHEGNFVQMEGKVDRIFSLTAEKIMSKNPVTVSPNTPLLKAQSMMFVNKIGRLPVVDNNEKLVGMITNGDIFRATVGDKLPFSGEEEYHDWQARHYDIVTKWDERLKNEIPDLMALFRKNKIQDIVDIGFGTGEHDVALSKKGFNILGIESSSLMSSVANEKIKNLPERVSERLNFVNGNYIDVLSNREKKFGGAIFMGNAFSHLVPNYKKVISAVSSALLPKNSVIVLQIVNFEKIFNIKKRVFDINFARPKHKFLLEQAFLRFYDPPSGKNGYLTLNTAVFEHDGKKWKFRSMNSAPIVNLHKEDIGILLKKNGFKSVSFYGGKFLGKLFQDPFDPKESDWLNVVAKR